MSVDTYVGIEGFSVNVENAEDVYNTLDGMHSQSMENVGENDELTMFLADIMLIMRDKIDLDENELIAP